MRDDVVLVYETETKTGTPALRVVCGKPPFDGAELGELERELVSRYERLARGGMSGALTLRSSRFAVEVQPGNNPRQPKLLLRLLQNNEGLPRLSVAPAAHWSEGLFQEVRPALDGPTGAQFLHERGALTTVLDELRSLTGASGVGLGVVLLAGYLTTAEQHCREHDPARSGVYVLAWRCLSRFLPEAGAGALAPSEPATGAALPAAEAQTANWLRWLFRWVPYFADEARR